MPLWEEVYRQAFPTFASMASITDLGLQRKGIDRQVLLQGGKSVYVDEKMRRRVWPDVLLEVWSNVEREHPGWMAKDLYCDYLGYGFAMVGKAYVLPFQSLRVAYREHGRAWARRYGFKDSDNGTYTTRSIPVPWEMLMDAVRDAMCIQFTPWKAVDAQHKYLCRTCGDSVLETDLFGDCVFCNPAYYL